LLTANPILFSLLSTNPILFGLLTANPIFSSLMTGKPNCLMPRNLARVVGLPKNPVSVGCRPNSPQKHQSESLDAWKPGWTFYSVNQDHCFLY
jgi:hypothetical protein